MHFTLISPPMISTYENSFYTGRRGGPPLSIAYLARVLHNCHIDYDVIDCMAYDDVDGLQPWDNLLLSGLAIDKAVDMINPKTNVVGITAMFTSEWIIVREMARRIKLKYPNMLIITGGEHATADAENIITYDSEIDFCFLGESEDSLEFFVKNLSANEHFKTPGVVYRDNVTGKPVKNPRGSRKKNLDTLLPLWDKIDVNYYVDRKYSYSRLGTRAMPILSTRGCPYKCTFCTNEQMWGPTYVMRSVDSVIQEMKYNIETYDIEHFDFLDLATSVNRRWFVELTKAIIKELPGISWEMTVGTRSEILDEEVLTLIRDSGNLIVGVAPEAGSETMIKKVKKKLDFPKFFNTIRTAVRLNLDVKANIIIGFPHETPRELFDTIFLCLKLGWLGVKGISIFKFVPFPGSELSTQYFKLLYPTREEYDQYLRSQAGTGGAKVVNPLEFFKNPEEQFYAFISNVVMVLAYFLSMVRRPRYFKQFFVNILTGQPVSAVEVAIYFLLIRFGVFKIKPHERPRKPINKIKSAV